MTDERFRTAVTLAERFADGLVSASDRRTTAKALHTEAEEHFLGQSAAGAAVSMPAFRAAESGSWYLADYAVDVADPTLGWRGAFDNERDQQALLLRDIFGNPLRPVAFDPVWRSETTICLASAIYDDHAFERLPILADALEDAGCDHTDILTHCRGDGPHVRGCWVIDLLLGKE